ncbi:RNA polymerase sigma-70 factor (ECF subfamily) [Roseivirga pacifica]|uniref:RNA polymerase sigma-70 factor, ECF subfamily n=1 Tax=Roseivirga pacifica TaxID=1267423 RepID=A0A1I0M7Q6_9BACT|nr:RNA polymerase sigma factor [Roseivirga pacifica]RKQ50148.1 RNA polymerase sigma-70 factor (ECF subfamily) [Roseivirga pacifica]SEV84342.1 RNA polymerase sigma-70 factor, ECF subfamily [Roseivirga pacifica]
MAETRGGSSANLSDGNEVIERICKGDQSVISAIYRQLRPEFLSWAAVRFRVDQDKIVDVFQESVIIFYRNVAKGKLTELNISVKTYLFAIGKNLLLKTIRDEKVQLDIDELPAETFKDWELEKAYEESHRKQLLSNALDALGPPCKQIILMFYYREFSMEAIQEQLEYKSEAVARTQKKRCMQYLREVLNTKDKKQ